MLRRVLLIIITSLIPACEPADNDPGPGGVSVGEAKELDEAAAIVEARRKQVAAPAADQDTER